MSFFFFFNDTATTEIYTLSLHDALPISREAKYKSKNFIDTVVFRSGDAASGWVYAALKGLGLGLAGLAAAAIPGVILWFVLGLWLCRQHARKSSTTLDAKA